MNVVVHWIYILGVVSAAASGVLAASRKQLDWFGATVIAMVTAVGGGTARDLLLGIRPVFWVTDPSYPMIAFVSAIVSIVLVRHRVVPRRMLAVVDAVALGAFSAAGAHVALAAGARPLIAVVMGTMTSVVGGVSRDVLCAEVPFLFRGEVYALAAIAGATTYVTVLSLTQIDGLATAAGMLVAIALRGSAIVFNLRVPEVPRFHANGVE